MRITAKKYTLKVSKNEASLLANALRENILAHMKNYPPTGQGKNEFYTGFANELHMLEVLAFSVNGRHMYKNCKEAIDRHFQIK